jgi:hypothetical protein
MKKSRFEVSKFVPKTYELGPNLIADRDLMEATAAMLWSAANYIIKRRPHELVTIAILNEKAYDVLDRWQGEDTAKGIN